MSEELPIRSFSDLFSAANDLLHKAWKPLAFGFGITSIVGAMPWVVTDVAQHQLFRAFDSSGNEDFFTILAHEKGHLAQMFGLLLAVLILYVLVFNFAVALAQVSLRDPRPDDLGRLLKDAGREFYPAMGTLAVYSLVFLVPAVLIVGAVWTGMRAVGGSGSTGAPFLVGFLAAVAMLVSVPLFWLSVGGPAVTKEQGVASFSRAMKVVGENVGEVFLMAIVLLGVAMLFGLLSMVLEAPLPSGDSGMNWNDLLADDRHQLVSKLLKPAVVPIGSQIARIVIDAAVYVARMGFTVSFVTVWFAWRSGASAPAWQSPQA
jgi:hypothetical protein